MVVLSTWLGLYALTLGILLFKLTLQRFRPIPDPVNLNSFRWSALEEGISRGEGFCFKTLAGVQRRPRLPERRRAPRVQLGCPACSSETLGRCASREGRTGGAVVDKRRRHWMWEAGFPLSTSPRVGKEGTAASGPWCSLQHSPAVDRDALAGDPVGQRRGEEDDDLRHLLGTAEPAERDAAQDRVVKRRIVGLALLPAAAGELDRAGRDAIDPDALAASTAASLCVYGSAPP